MSSLGFRFAYAPSYSIIWKQSIENLFGIWKNQIKKKRLQKLIKNNRIVMGEIIEEAMDSIN